MPLQFISPKEKMHFGQCANERKKEHLRVLPEDAPFFAVQTALRIKTYLKNDEYALLTAAVRSVSDVRKRLIILRFFLKNFPLWEIWSAYLFSNKT